MAQRVVERLLTGGTFFEGVRWHDGAWWVSDMYVPAVKRVAVDGSAETVATVAGRPSGLGWLPDGSLLVSSMLERRVLRVPAGGGEPALHADVSSLTVTGEPGELINDMVVDAAGRAYVGSFGFDFFGGGQPAPGNIIKVDPDGSAAVAAEGLLFPNGMVITPDGGTLIVAETFGARFTAFDIAADGSLSNQRVWGQVGRQPSYESFEAMLDTDFAPDGCGIDAEGHVWVADALGARACRVAPGGAIVDEVAAPEGHGLFSCNLGGADGRTLIACVAPSFSPEERMAANEAELVTYRVEVPAA